MHNVVVIGAGLTGLAAAYELQQQQIETTLIEVKARLGGSMMTTVKHGFVIDGGAMLFECVGDWSFLSELGLDDVLFTAASNAMDVVGFKQGTGVLIDSFARVLTGTVITRMAVSSIGQIDGCFTICMENGLMFDARAIIVTAPARYAERIFRTLQPQVAQPFLDYEYAHVIRVSLGYPREVLRDLPVLNDLHHAPYLWTDNHHRVPENHVLLQIPVPFDAAHSSHDALVAAALKRHHLPANPIVAHVHDWPEAAPITRHTSDYMQHMDLIGQLLPDGVVLAGSDYRGDTLPDRVSQGRKAACQIAAFLK